MSTPEPATASLGQAASQTHLQLASLVLVEPPLRSCSAPMPDQVNAAAPPGGPEGLAALPPGGLLPAIAPVFLHP